MKQKLLYAGLISMALLAVGCKKPNPNEGSAIWYDVYGTECGQGKPKPGCNFYADYNKMILEQDESYTGQEMTYATWTFTDSYGNPGTFEGYAWQNPEGIIYDEWGYALNGDEDQDGRDLISGVEARENRVVERAGKAFARKHELAEATGIRIARTLNDWATLSKREKRARTDMDMQAFSRRLLGVDSKKVEAALDAASLGDSRAVERVNDEVAAFWGTSPETSKTILKRWYDQQITK